MADARFQTVARVGEIAEGIGHAAEVEGRAVAVFFVEGKYYALEDVCAHQAFPLNDGIVVDRTLTCLYHGWKFHLSDGRWDANPRIQVPTYTVRVVGDEVQVSVESAE